MWGCESFDHLRGGALEVARDLMPLPRCLSLHGLAPVVSLCENRLWCSNRNSGVLHEAVRHVMDAGPLNARLAPVHVGQIARGVTPYDSVVEVSKVGEEAPQCPNMYTDGTVDRPCQVDLRTG
eukprot:12617688-Alexandrium_andersonii.AAC.1